MPDRQQVKELIMQAHPNVQGTCPACGGTGTLFLAAGGYITCSLDRCPEPDAVATLLERPNYHVIEFGADGWALQHAITCFPDLLDCEVHERVVVWMDALTGPPVPEGRYRIRESDLRLTPLEEAGGDT